MRREQLWIGALIGPHVLNPLEQPYGRRLLYVGIALNVQTFDDLRDCWEGPCLLLTMKMKQVAGEIAKDHIKDLLSVISPVVV